MSAARYMHARRRADAQIRKWGQRAVLRRTSGDRECWVLEVQLSASERLALKNFTARTFIISAVNDDLLAVPPGKEDSLILFVETVEQSPLRQHAPVYPLAPGGVVVYWEIQVQ